MDRKANRHRARSLAVKLLKECNISEPPIRISELAKKLDLIVSEGDISKLDLFRKKNLSAFIALEEGIVVYNPTHPLVRKRFSVAHEIGHYVLGHSFGNDIFNLDSKDSREVEANMFAAEVLIPYEWVKKDLALGLRVPDLARKYWVSEESIGWRLFKSDALLLS